MTTATLTREQTERLAEYLVLARFDTWRQFAFGDMAAGRRGHELSKLADALIESGVRVVCDDSDESPFGGYGFPVPPRHELIAAFDRVARPRIARIARESYRSTTPYSIATLKTWVRVANALGIPA